MPKTSHAAEAIWMVSREYDRLAGAGGVKDVARQLAEALVRTGRQVTVVLPAYGFLEPAAAGFAPAGDPFAVDMPYVGVERREKVQLWAAVRQGVRLLLVEADRFREKHSVYTYTAEEEAKDPFHRQGSGHYDYFAMNVLLQKACLAALLREGVRPAVIHAHDGHTAILPAMMRELEGFRHWLRDTGALVTIHNAGLGYHQEVDDLPFAQTICGLPGRLILRHQLHGRFDPFLAAADYAVMTTVSENYARELQETDQDRLTGWLGHTLAERGVRITGVTNGISPADYDPSRPQQHGLAAAFDAGRGDLAGKAICRQTLVDRLAAGATPGLDQTGFLASRPGQPLFTLISRFMAQKGVDLLVAALADLLPRDPDFQVLILGSGAKDLETALMQLAADPANQGRLCLLRGFSATLADQIYAAGDFFLVPSRYEPCGLTDFIAQLFGNLPVVHHVGGLVKVVDGETGLAFHEPTAAALTAAMERALALFRSQPQAIRAMQQAAVRRIHDRHTWDRVVSRYLDLYQRARPR
ncbi:MAG: glycogen/starch synthase [Thermodesulfobacteriota bacterium]